LSSLTEIRNSVMIQNNAALPQTAVDSLTEHLVQIGFSGTTEVGGNRIP